MSDTSNLREPASAELLDLLNASGAALGIKKVYPGYIASLIRRALNHTAPLPHADDARADLMQANGLYGVHQLRVRLAGDDTVYRIIVAPANAPIAIGGVPADQHFSLPLHDGLPPKLTVVERDPRDPDPTKDGIFRDHRCARCADGSRLDRCPTPNRPGNCGYPHARNY